MCDSCNCTPSAGGRKLSALAAQSCSPECSQRAAEGLPIPRFLHLVANSRALPKWVTAGLQASTLAAMGAKKAAPPANEQPGPSKSMARRREREEEQPEAEERVTRRRRGNRVGSGNGPSGEPPITNSDTKLQNHDDALRTGMHPTLPLPFVAVVSQPGMPELSNQWRAQMAFLGAQMKTSPSLPTGQKASMRKL